MTDEEYDALDELWTETTPKVNFSRSGAFARQRILQDGNKKKTSRNNPAIIICVGIFCGLTACASVKGVDTYVVERSGFTIRLPKSYEGKVVFVNDTHSLGECIIEVYQKKSYEEFNQGLIFHILRNTPDKIIGFFFQDNPEVKDLNGVKYFAKDSEYIYMCEIIRTINTYDPIVDVKDLAVREEYSALSDDKIIDEVLDNFVQDNKLEKYSNEESVEYNKKLKGSIE